MKRILTFLLYVLCGILPACSDSPDLRHLYNTLDSVISCSPRNIAAKEARIDSMKARLAKEKNLSKRFDVTMDVFLEYKSFSNDSAISYITRCIDVSEKLGDKRKESLSKIRLAYQCSMTGMYNEALDILANLPVPEGTDSLLLGEYYLTYVHVYGELGYYSKIGTLRKKYFDKQKEYCEKMYSVLDDNSDDYLQRKEMEYYSQKDFRNAIAINDKRMKMCDEETHVFAIVAFYRFLDYRLTDDTDMQKYWLLRSAIVDAKMAIMDQGAMWELSNILLQEGDQHRAYRYINFAWDCANRFSTRVRSWQISPVLSTVDRYHQEYSDRTNRLLLGLVVVVSILGGVLLVTLFYANRQRKKLYDSHKELRDTYSQLSESNKNLSVLFAQLQETNGQLSKLNAEILESNKVKEEYIGRFLQLCSQYVDRLEALRKRVYKMMKGRDVEKLMTMLKSSDFQEKELDELYLNFDTSFQYLFPDFVEGFNALLKPEERVEVRHGQALPTAVRIYALIRLGVTDSSKIAKFLHYSVNTIYNYRARVKNAALNDRENFEARVMKIGKPE